MCDLHNLIGQLQWRDVKIPIIKGFDGEMLKIDQHNPLHSILRFNPAQKQKPGILTCVRFLFYLDTSPSRGG